MRPGRSGRRQDIPLSVCQALTIATTEPTNLLHSRPAKPTQARAKPLLLSAPGGQQDPAPEVPGPAPEAPSESSSGPSLAEGDFPVDFEKIYKYLASFSRGGQGPELSATGEKTESGGAGVGCSMRPPPSLTLPISLYHQRRP